MTTIHAVYLHGSEGAGTARTRSDIDIVAITDDGTIDRVELTAILNQLRLDRTRPLDLTVATIDGLDSSHLWRNTMQHARLLAGQPITLNPPDPAAWAVEARNAALLAAIRDNGPRDRDAARAWLAAAEQVEHGGEIPAGKHEVVRVAR